MRRIKVWGGTHPNEQLGLDVVDSLRADPIDGVDADIANLRARAMGRRLVDINMGHAYPGDASSHRYEERRAVEVLRESLGYYAVLDLHAINAGWNNADFAGLGKRNVRPEIYGFLAELGIRNIVRTSSNSLVQHVSDGLLLDIPVNSFRSDIDYWRQALSHFAGADKLPVARPEDFSWYHFVENVHVDQFEPKNLSDIPQAFGCIPEELSRQFDRVEPLVWLNYNLDPNNLAQTRGYWAELAVNIEPPFTS